VHTVAILALDRALPFSLATAVEVFERARLPGGRPAYRVLVCAAAEEVDAGAFAVRTPFGLDALADADTVVLPGTADPLAQSPDAVLDALRGAVRRGARVAAVGGGAFVPAAAGLLDGLRATTCPECAGELARRYPKVEVEPDAPIVDCGQLVTSVGLGLYRYLIRQDHGAVVAAGAAAQLRDFVAWRSDGAETRPSVQAGLPLAALLHWMGDNAHLELTLADIARQAAMSTRTLSRRFREQTGSTPLQWLNQARLRRARYLLETTDFSVEQIAGQVGFGSPNILRDHFRRFFGSSPQAYRSALRSSRRSRADWPESGGIWRPGHSSAVSAQPKIGRRG